MKKAINFLLGTAAVVAQPRAIGVNLGYGVDLSYQHGFGDANMLDVSVNIPAFNGIGLCMLIINSLRGY